MQNKKLPELLAPAGSPEALQAAVAGGADAVYFGGAGYSNRMRARNFTNDQIADAISFCHSYGVKCYLTVNTRVRDIEMAEVLGFCRHLAQCGADALIVADMGIAAAVAEKILPHFPWLELHASTQMSLASPLDGIRISCIQFFTSATLSGIAMFIFESPSLGAIMDGWISVAYAGILSSGVAYTLQILGQQRTDPAVASILMSLESLFAVLGTIVFTAFLGSVQFPTVREWIGCALMFAVQIIFVDLFALETDTLRLNLIQALVCTVLSAVVMLSCVMLSSAVTIYLRSPLT